MKKEEVYGHIDHTLLKAFSTTEQIEAIAEEALKYGTASICIPASFVNYIHNKYKDVNICTVIGFPLGYSTTSIKVAEAKQAIEDGANEIDMVINIGWAKEHMISSVEKLISAGCNMITICPCNDTMLIKVAKLCEENKVYWAVAWRDILDPEVRDVVYASPYFCGTAVQSDLNAGYAAVKAMGEAGMKKIGLISLDKSSSCAALREKGMQKALDEYGMEVVAEARDLQQAADAAQAVESFIVANPDLDGVYIACSMGMNILDGTLSALEQYDPDNHIKISVIDFLTGLDTCFEKDRIICAQGGIYIPVQIACGMLEMNAILNGGRLGGQAWDVPISFGAVGSAEEFKDYSKFCEGALPTYTFEELQNLFITYNPDVTGEDIIAWGNAFNLADIYAAHADLAAPVKGPNGVEYVPFAK